jgi:hypothetical protein
MKCRAQLLDNVAELFLLPWLARLQISWHQSWRLARQHSILRLRQIAYRQQTEPPCLLLLRRPPPQRLPDLAPRHLLLPDHLLASIAFAEADFVLTARCASYRASLVVP